MSRAQVKSRVLIVIRSIAIAAALLAALGADARTRASAKPRVTFADVYPLFATHCIGCHQDGGIGPFSLTTYERARPFAVQIGVMTATRKMPPWKPVEGCGDFVGARRLADRDISLIRAWIAGGAVEGPKVTPVKPPDPAWALGTPDLLLVSEQFAPPPVGDTFRGFVLPPLSMTEDTYVRAVDVRPLAREFVHHVGVVVDTTGETARMDAADPQPGFDWFDGAFALPLQMLGTWVPNAEPFSLPDGAAIRVPAGARIALQVHYHPHDGHIHPDREELGVYLANGPVQKLVSNAQFYVQDINLPAGANNVVVSTVLPVPEAMEVFAILPHMHYLGRSITAEAVLPGGARQCLVTIDDWDIAWQGSYRYAVPLRLPAGTTIHVSAVYDNSADNPRNPSSPPRDVRQGFLATDEMCGVELTYAPLTP